MKTKTNLFADSLSLQVEDGLVLVSEKYVVLVQDEEDAEQGVIVLAKQRFLHE